jgi:hypothetical protein
MFSKWEMYRADVLFWKRLVLSFITLALLYFWYSGMMLHHVYDSPFYYKGADITYWMFYWLQVPQLVLGSESAAWIFDLLLILGFISSIAFIDKRGFTIISGILLIVYQVLFNYKIGYHTHHLYGFQFALLPFYFSRGTFGLATRFAGILACCSYAFAGFSKLYHKGWLVFNSFSDILQNQHAGYFYLQQEHWRSALGLWLIGHPLIGYLFFGGAMLLQLSFAIGILTVRWNVVFALFIVLFHLMDWWLMNLGVFMSMTVMAWLFLYKPARIQAHESVNISTIS